MVSLIVTRTEGAAEGQDEEVEEIVVMEGVKGRWWR